MWFVFVWFVCIGFIPSDFGHPEGTWKYVPVLQALLSSSCKRPSASAGVELLEVAPTLLIFRSVSRVGMLMECLLPP